jgi:hypothetical protein
MTVSFTICEAETGRPLRPGSMATEADAAKQVRPGETLYLGALAADQYLVDGKPVQRQQQPSPDHRWVWSAHAWLEDLDGARQAARERIEIQRLSLTVQPIEFEGLALDADITAQGNVSAKLQEIAQCRLLGTAMPAELLFWRDADNVTHAFDSLDAYATWLGRLAIAITRRGTEAYAWAWAQKKAVETAATLAAIQAIPTIETTTTESTA